MHAYICSLLTLSICLFLFVQENVSSMIECAGTQFPVTLSNVVMH